MVRRWDTSLNAFRDVETIRRYDKDLRAWVDVEAAYITEDGVKRQVWPERLYLLRNGQTTAVSGGYTAYTYMSAKNNPAGTKVVLPVATNSSGSMDVKISRYSDNFHGVGSIFFNRKFDMSPYKRLCANISEVSDMMYGWNDTIVTDSIQNQYNIIRNAGNSLLGLCSVDISTLSGSHYIVMEFCRATAGISPAIHKITDIWLEA